MSFIDDLIGVFSPERKFKRLAYRKALETRKYEGASKGRRTKNWYTSATSANAEIRKDLITLRNRSRDLVRNNPYAARAIHVIASNTVGKGIIPQIIHPSESQKETIRQTWKLWAETTACDYDGLLSFAGLQHLVMKAVPESGEVFIRKRFVRSFRESDVIPMKLQVLESDFCPVNTVPSTKPDDGNVIIQGIEFDPNGKRVAYHFYEDHPGNNSVGHLSGLYRSAFNTIRVPAEEVIHVYRIDRPGQIRGVPWLAPVMLRLRDLDEYEDAQLVRQKIAACFSVFVKDLEGFDATIQGQKEAELLDKVEPGIIELLPPGKDVTFAEPPEVKDYKEFTSVSLHGIAAGLNISYEVLVGDLAEVNFSSARMGWIEFNRQIEAWRQLMLQPSLNDTSFSWFLESLGIFGTDIEQADWSWSAPKREMIDPTKEVPAKIKAIRGGLETLPEAIRQNGGHIEDHIQEIKESNALLDAAGLVLDSDPRKIDNSGSFQEEEVDNNSDEESSSARKLN